MRWRPDCQRITPCAALWVGFVPFRLCGFPNLPICVRPGAQLRHAVELHLMPQPVDQSRVDIHG